MEKGEKRGDETLEVGAAACLDGGGGGGGAFSLSSPLFHPVPAVDNGAGGGIFASLCRCE
jgi:hypothetical protein